MKEDFLIDQCINDMMNIITWLQGKKTYILAIGATVVFLLNILGYIPNEIATQWYRLLGIGSVATMGAKVNRMIKSK